MTNKINIRTAVAFWLVTVAYMGTIFFLSSITFILPKLPSNSDKIIHLIMYIPLGLLLFLSFERSGLKKYLFAVSLVIGGIYGVSDEIHQSFVPGRVAAASDAVADFIGVFVGCYAAGRTLRK
ncbi:MAG: VanZ family protein [Nitrospirae bacterium]|nr:VanZ family protein [Nitrospirota bacterium]